MFVSPILASAIAAVDADRRPHGHDGPLVGHADELLVVGAPAGVLGHPDPGEELALTDSRLEQVTEEVTGCHGPLAARPDDDELGVEGERQAPTSPAGSAWTSAPPTVPRWRICRSATSLMALASSAACWRTASLASTSAYVVIAPMTTWSLVADAAQLVEIRPRSTTFSGALRRMRRMGSRLWPPASTFASSPASASTPSASCSVVGAVMLERCGDHWSVPFCSASGMSWFGAPSSKCGWAPPETPAPVDLPAV